MKQVVYFALLLLVQIIYGQSMDKKWTTLLFINANNDLVYYSELDFEEIRQFGSLKNQNLIVQVNREKNKFSRCDTKWEGTYRFEINEDNYLCPIERKMVKTDGKSYAQTLQDFIGFVKGKYKPSDNNYLMIFWDHGNKWIVPDKIRNEKDEQLPLLYSDYIAEIDSLILAFQNLDYESQAFEKTNFDDFARNTLVSNPINTILYDKYQSVELEDKKVLKLEDLDEVIEDGLFEILAFDSCLMATVETAYSTREKAHLMVASEKIVPSFGYNYFEILKSIETNPNILPVDLANEMVNLYGKSYPHDNEASLSALDMSVYDDVHDLLNEICIQLISILEDEHDAWPWLKRKIKRARRRSISYGTRQGVGSIDLISFLNHLSNKSRNKLIMQDYSTLVTELIGLIRDEFVISKYGNDGGVAIYFPNFSDQNSSLSDSYIEENRSATSIKTIPFIHNSKWDNFILTYRSKL